MEPGWAEAGRLDSRSCRCEACVPTWLGDGRTVSQMPYLALEKKAHLPRPSFLSCPASRGRVFHTPWYEVCRRSGRLPGRRCCLLALGGTSNGIFPQVRLTRLQALCLPRGTETVPHTYHCSFMRGDWFPCEGMCVCVFKKNLQHLNCRFLNSTVWKHS